MKVSPITLAAFLLFPFLFDPAFARGPLEPLTDAQTEQARNALATMKKNPKGPYQRLRWYCNDGTVQPPAGTPCKERGGGVQHAELTGMAQQLESMHLYLNSVLTDISLDVFLDAGKDHHRAKSWVVAHYLYAVDDGWIFRRAKFYRGSRQIEDEERQGQAFLAELLGDRVWTRKNFLLATPITRTLPHDRLDRATTTKIRTLATEIAELEENFQPLRSKIHSYPARADIAAVAGHRERANQSKGVLAKLAELHAELERKYDPQRIQAALGAFEKKLPKFAVDIAGLADSLETESSVSFSRMAGLAAKLRRSVTEGSDGTTNLLAMDLIALLSEKAQTMREDLEQSRARWSRSERLRGLEDYFDFAFSTGFLSGREREALRMESGKLAKRRSISALEYRNALDYLLRSVEWASTSARAIFGSSQERYARVEPKALGFFDELLRSSTLLLLSTELGKLSQDADQQLAQSHSVFGRRVAQGIRGLNSGAVKAKLEIVSTQKHDWKPDSGRIYLIPGTISDLKPMAGILTLDLGNLLSHAQLLARNLSIPNAAVSTSLLPSLKRHEGKEILFAVSPMGLVTLKDASRMTAPDAMLIEQEKELRGQRIRLDTGRLLHSAVTPVSLYDLRAWDSGVLVGPKAANLGELYASFPDKVAPGLALPFGMYRAHIDRPYGSEQTLREQIQQAYQAAEAMRLAGRSETEIDDYMLPRLDRFRRAVVELEWIPEMKASVQRSIRRVFGASVSKGVFIRSDTNAEDLEEFSGAGLNLTVAHRVTEESILEAIKKVWASPLSDRAYSWRKQFIENPGDVYTSVLLLQSIHSEKSGVMITADLESLESPKPTDRLTIVTAEGVGGGVEGESAETLLVDSAGDIRLLSQAKAPYRRYLDDGGGVKWTTTQRSDYLLTTGEIKQLRQMVKDWRSKGKKQASQTWDIEFGFAEGKLWLFQIRPFVAEREGPAWNRLKSLDRKLLDKGEEAVNMRESL